MRRRNAVALLALLGGILHSAGSLLAQEDASLQAIREYQAQPQEVSRTINTASQKLADVVNLFPAQRRGVFHGSVYEYHRNDNFDARNFFDPVGEPLPEYKRNQFGTSVGLAPGNRLHLTGSFDGLRINQGSTLLSHVPSDPLKAGDFTELGPAGITIRDPRSGAAFPGNRIPAERIHPVSRSLLPLLPRPNRADASRNFVNNQPEVLNQNSLTGRVDLEWSAKDRFTASYETVMSEEQEVASLPAFGSRREWNSHDLSTSYTHTFSSSLTASWAIAFERESEAEVSRDQRESGLLSRLGIQGISASGPEEEGYPVFQIAGYQTIGDSGTPDGSVNNRFELEADQSYVRGNHHLQFGQELDFRQINNYRSPSLLRGSFAFNGFFTGEPFADFLLGLADTATRAVGTSRQDLRNRSVDFFAVDDWKVSSRLSLTFGAGYSYFSPYASTHANLSVLRPLLFEPVDSQLIELQQPAEGRAGKPQSVVQSDWNDFTGQLGFALRPFQNSWLVIRGSYGLFYDAMDSNWYLAYMGRNFPHYYTDQAQSPPSGGGLDLSMPFETAVPTEQSVRDIEPGARTPQFHEWGLTIENEFRENWTLSAEYEGEKATRLTRVLPANTPLPGPGDIQPRRPNPAFGSVRIVTTGASYVSHSLDFTAERRLADGFSFRTGFDWQRGFSDQSEMISNPRNLRAERALVSQLPFSWFLNYIVDLPSFGESRLGTGGPWYHRILGGWRLSGIARFNTGHPVSVHLPGDRNNDGLTGDRPDRVGNGLLDTGRTIDRWFRTEDFAAPPAYGFGNSGRNILRAPSYRNWDVSLSKISRLPNGHRIELRVELFNALNQVNFEPPDHHFGTGNFGKIFGAERAREIEVALKYAF